MLPIEQQSRCVHRRSVSTSTTRKRYSEEKLLTVTPSPLSCSCEVGNFEAGIYNVSVLLPNGLAFTNPDVASGLYSRNHKGGLYQVRARTVQAAAGNVGAKTFKSIMCRNIELKFLVLVQNA